MKNEGSLNELARWHLWYSGHCAVQQKATTEEWGLMCAAAWQLSIPGILCVLLCSMYGWAGTGSLITIIAVLSTTPLYYDRRLRAMGEVRFTH